MNRLLDALSCADNDPVIARCIGLILSGALLLGWFALRLTKGA